MEVVERVAVDNAVLWDNDEVLIGESTRRSWPNGYFPRLAILCYRFEEVVDDVELLEPLGPIQAAENRTKESRRTKMPFLNSAHLFEL